MTKVKCKGLTETHLKGWATNFRPGETYNAPKRPKKLAKFPELMVVECKPGRPIVVDADQFEEVFENESVNGILSNTSAIPGTEKRPKFRSFRFMCRGTRELRFQGWAANFGSGRIYSAPKVFHQLGNPGGLVLDAGNGKVYAVDADQFIEME